MIQVQREPMGRKRKPGKVPTATAKVAADLHRKVKMIATHRGVEMFDYLDALLRPAVERDFERMLREAGEVT
jgi:hypothetical protein